MERGGRVPQVLFVPRGISARRATGRHVRQALEGDHYLGADHCHIDARGHSRATSVVAAVKQANGPHRHAWAYEHPGSGNTPSNETPRQSDGVFQVPRQGFEPWTR